ncbi:MAG TPA: hypothetical protein ENH82_19400 [bacterium]|nr:hypothetical protein [bacterium]
MPKTERYIEHNFSSRRKSKPFIHVVHYTGSDNVDSTLDWFSRPESRVSAHEVIDKNGDRYLVVPKEMKAWHAGTSVYYGKTHPEGRKYINDISFGYELVGTYGSEFTDPQYESLADAILDVLYDQRFEKATIDSLWDTIVGHEHVALRRKIDPGPSFSWIKLYRIIQRKYSGTIPSIVFNPPIISYIKDNYQTIRS